MAKFRQPPKASGASAVIVSKTITANGTYNASSESADGFDPVIVNVPQKTIVSKSITANGTYNASADSADGFDPVTVNVPQKVIVSKAITENGTYNASADSADGFDPVVVNVPPSEGRLIDHTSRRYSGWYIGSQTFKLDSEDPHAVTMSWPVENGHKYIIMSGIDNDAIPTRHRYGFADNDLVNDPVQTVLNGYFEDDISRRKEYSAYFTAPQTGYLIGYIALPSVDNNIVVYLMDITGKDISGHLP